MKTGYFWANFISKVEIFVSETLLWHDILKPLRPKTGPTLSFPDRSTLLFPKSKQGRPPRKSEKGAVRCCRRAMREYNSAPYY